MELLLDECVNRRLARALTGHTVHQMGWSGIKNGHLLALAETVFDVLITVDKNLQYQQNIANYNIAIVVLDGPSIKLADLLTMVPNLLAALPTAPRGVVTVVTP